MTGFRFVPREIVLLVWESKSGWSSREGHAASSGETRVARLEMDLVCSQIDSEQLQSPVDAFDALLWMGEGVG